MNKIIASFTLASLAMACAACDEPELQAAEAPPSVEQVSASLPDAEAPPMWRVISHNRVGTQYIDLNSWIAPTSYDPRALASFKTRYWEPIEDVASTTAYYEFDCTNGLLRLLVADTYDKDDNHIQINNEPTDWMKAENGKVSGLYYEVACKLPALGDG